MAPMVAEALAWVDQQLPINNRKLIIRVTFEFKWTCFLSTKLPINNVTLCRPSPGVFMMEQHCSVRELNCIMLVRLTGAMDARTVTFRGHAM